MSVAERLVSVFRSDTRDTVAPYIWSDDEVYEYLGEAYLQYATFTGGVPDFFSDDLLVEVSADERSVDLHPSILRIINVRRDSDGSLVQVVNMEDLLSNTLGDYGTVYDDMFSDRKGRVTHLVLGVGNHKALVLSTPEESDTLRLHVMRLPINGEVNASSELPDVPVQHARSLVMWMKHLGYNKQDADTYNPQASAEFEQAFRLYCSGAKSELERQKSKVRVVSYGGL